MRSLALLLSSLSLTSALAAQPSSGLPDPLHFADGNCVSFGVVQVRPEDTAFQAAFQAVARELETRQLDSASWIGILSSLLSQNQRAALFSGLLPAQGIRVDYLDAQGGLHSATVVTCTGWKGFQALLWGRLMMDKSGQPWPVEKVGRNEVVLRKDGTVARINGSFYAFSDKEIARTTLERKPAPAPKDFAELDKTHDTYGLLFNRQNSLARFLRWVDRHDYAAVQKAFGEARFSEANQAVDSVRWTGELLDDDRVSLEIRVRLKEAGKAELVDEFLSVARQILKERGRPARVESCIVDDEVLINAEIAGNRSFFLNYFTSSKPV